jgi:outer membrane protein TolC
MNPSSLVRYLFIVGISTSIGRSFAAQPVTLAPATTGYSLTAIIEQALARNEWALSFAERIQEKKFAADQARRWRNPELNFAAGRKEVASSDGSIIEASLAQPIFLPGKLQLRGKIAGADTEMAVLNRTKNEIALRHQVVRLAYRYSVDRQKSEFARQRRERFELIRSYLSGRPFASPQKKAERHLVENRLRELMVENLEIETSRKNSLERLKLYTPLDESTAGSVEIPWLKGDNHLDRSQWETAGREKNPDLAAQRLELSRASQELALAKKERWPDFSLSVFYRRETANETEKASGAGIALPFSCMIWFVKYNNVAILHRPGFGVRRVAGLSGWRNGGPWMLWCSLPGVGGICRPCP